MKKQNLFFAIVLISFTSTFMSCQKEALITNEIQSNYEVPIDNDAHQLKYQFDPSHSDFEDLKSNELPVRFVQNACINGGVNLTATHPTLGADFYANSNFSFEWLDANGTTIESNKRPSLSCVCTGTYILKINRKGIGIANYRTEVKSKCSGYIQETF